MPKGRNWYELKAQGPTISTPTILIYDDIGDFGITAQDFARDLATIDSNTIDVRISSNGGSVAQSITIHNLLADHPADVHVTVDGWALSGASLIAMAGDRVTMNRNSEMMIHQSHGGFHGNATEGAKFVEVLENQDVKQAAIYSARAGGDPSVWRALMEAETWFSAQEAVAAGLADSAVIDEWDDPEAGSEPVEQGAQARYRYACRAEAPAPGITTPNLVGETGPELVQLVASGPTAEELAAIMRNVLTEHGPTAIGHSPADPPTPDKTAALRAAFNRL